MTHSTYNGCAKNFIAFVLRFSRNKTANWYESLGVILPIETWLKQVSEEKIILYEYVSVISVINESLTTNNL